MRVLVLHSPYLSGVVSGENRVVADEIRLLRRGGHDVGVYTPERLTGRIGTLREGVSAVWSRAATERVRKLVDEFAPDVVHCHNFFPALSPGVVRIAAQAGVPVVVTLHNHRMLCLPATLIRDGRVCEDCVGRLPWRGVVHRCSRDSTAASLSLAMSLSLHKTIGTFSLVRLYLAISDFVREKHIKAGLPADRVVTKPNFAWDAPRRDGPGDYFVYLGRVSAEKGLASLVGAWRGVKRTLVIAGDGPELDPLRKTAPPNVRFLGLVEPSEIPALLVRARALLLPSLSDAGGRTLLEAYASGVPVIATAVGGIPEFVEDGETGILVAPNDDAGIVAAVERLSDDDESLRLGEAAFRRWLEAYAPDQALKNLEASYREAFGPATAETANRPLVSDDGS